MATPLRAAMTAAELSLLARSREPVALEAVFGERGGLSVFGVPVRLGVSLAKRGDWKHALEVGALTRLRALSVNLGERDMRGSKRPELGPTWFWASPLVRQLAELEVNVPGRAQSWSHGPARAHDLSRWLDELRGLPRLERLIVRTLHQHRIVADLASLLFVLERCDRGFALRIQTNTEFHDELEIANTIAAFLSGFPRDDVPVATLEYLRGEAPPKMEELRSALASRFERIDVRGHARPLELE